MNRFLVGFGAGLIAFALVCVHSPARAEEMKLDGKVIAGAELGVVVPTNAFDRFSDTGGGIGPYVGYMFSPSEYVSIGPVLQMEFIGAPNKDRCGPRQVGGCPPGQGQLDDDATWAWSGGGGPRLMIPLSKDAELWGDFQYRFMTGLTPNGSITDSSNGFSTGGGINFPITDSFSVGAFGRWARQYQRIHAVGDVRYVFTGISLNYQQPPPPPPPVAQAPPPPPPPPAPPAKKKIVLRGVNFDFDKANIRPDARPVLDEAIRILKEEGGIAVISAGHTDSIGSDQYNMRLSLRRANAVRDYLIAGGISASRIRAEGFGESQPVASNETAEGRAQNRRVELRVLGQ